MINLILERNKSNLHSNTFEQQKQHTDDVNLTGEHGRISEFESSVLNDKKSGYLAGVSEWSYGRMVSRTLCVAAGNSYLMTTFLQLHKIPNLKSEA